MVLFFIILGIIIFNILAFIVLYLSILEIEVEKLKIDTENKINNFLIYIRLKLFKKITWAKIKIDDKGIEKYKNVNNKILKKIRKDLKKQVITKESIKNLKAFEIKIKKVDLDLKIGLLNPIATSFGVAIISSILSQIFARNIEEFNNENCKYKILPVYSNNLQIKINLNCIIYVKMVHIISIIYMLIKKGSEENGKLSSHRRSYESIHV